MTIPWISILHIFAAQAVRDLQGQLELQIDTGADDEEATTASQHLTANLPELPTDCSSGTLALKGMYQVTKHHAVEDRCKVMADAAELYLDSPLTFQHSVSFHGSLRIIGRGSRRGCLNISEDCTIYAEMNFSGCVKEEGEGGDRFGGAVRVGGMFLQESAWVSFHSCHVRGSGSAGGALFAGNGVQLKGTYFQNCSAGALGGGIYIQKGGLKQLAGTVSYKDCRSAEMGGAIRIDAGGLQQLAGTMSFENCESDDGGALAIKKDGLQQKSGVLRFQDCTASWGGCASISGDLISEGTMEFSGCTALNSGGALFADEGNSMFHGELRFHGCQAKLGNGGAIRFTGDLLSILSHANPVEFALCSSGGLGGAIHAHGNIELDHAVFHGCLSKSSASAVAVVGSLHASKLELIGTAEARSRQSDITTSLELIVGLLDCKDRETCKLKTADARLRVNNMTCPVGTGRAQRKDFVGCYPCEMGLTRLKGEANGSCDACPEDAERCEPSRVQMPAGLSINWTNLSQSVRCPNEGACPGGILHAMLGQQQPREEAPMCSDCHTGVGCAECDQHCARTDSSVLACAPCSTSSMAAAWKFVVYAGKGALLFALAARSVRAERKESSVYLNQLMAFTTVSFIILSAVRQTVAFSRLATWIRKAFDILDPIVNLAQDNMAVGPGRECIWAAMGFRKSLVLDHIFSSIVPSILMITLGFVREPVEVMIVGSNVFLPGFVACFGKYLVTFRFQPEGEVGGEALYPYLPDIPCAFLVVPIAILLCFVIPARGWIQTALSCKSPALPHVDYLTNVYKPECAAWEVERLIRKMLLTLTEVMLPVAVSPALQLSSVGMILLVSTSLHHLFQPYKEPLWNASEHALLSISSMMSYLTITLIAIDKHWARSDSVQTGLILAVTLLATATSGMMMAWIAKNMYHERTAAPRTE